MTTLARHILSLLRLYDSVALPGVGYFNLSYVGAYLDSEISAFFPPFYRLSFVADAQADDRLLLDSYIRRERGSRKNALLAMEKDLALLRGSLSEGSPVELPGIGILTPSSGTVSFTPRFALNPPLPVLRLKEEEDELPFDEEEVIVEELDDFSDSDIYHEAPIPVYGEAPPAEVPEPKVVVKRVEVVPEGYHYHDPAFYYFPLHKKLANIAACFILVVIVAIVALMPGNRSQSVAPAASIVPMSTGIDSNESPNDVPVLETTATPPAPVKEEEQPSENKINVGIDSTGRMADAKYFAVVGAFKSEAEAMKFIENHGGPKSNYEIIKKSKILYVTVASAAQKESLEQSMPLIRASFPDAWIYTLPS